MTAPIIQYREAVRGDAQGIFTLEAQSFESDRLNVRNIRALIASASAAVLVAMAGDTVAACLILLSRRGSRSQRIYSIAVAPAWRRRGIGGQLLALAEGRASRARARELRLEVRERNTHLRDLYGRRGYVVAAALPDYYADGADALRLVKQLDGGAA